MVFLWRTTLATIRIIVNASNIPRSKQIGKLPAPVYENRTISVKYVRGEIRANIWPSGGS